MSINEDSGKYVTGYIEAAFVEFQQSCGHNFTEKQQLSRSGNVSCFATLEAKTPRKFLRKQKTEARSTEQGASLAETDFEDSGGNFC